LEGAPQEVGGHFICWRNKLTTLKGAPKKVGGDFSCLENQLTSLEGAPQEVGGDFYCSGNPILINPTKYKVEIKYEISDDNFSEDIEKIVKAFKENLSIKQLENIEENLSNISIDKFYKELIIRDIKTYLKSKSK